MEPLDAGRSQRISDLTKWDSHILIAHSEFSWVTESYAASTIERRDRTVLKT